MADNKLLLKRDSDEDFLAEDDPLAELTRIVGFDPAPVAKPAVAQRREPAFDLEDELLKELEIYEQPAPVTAAAPAYVPVATPADAPSVMPEPVAATPEPFVAPAVETAPVAFEPAPAPVREPVILEAVETLADASHGRVYERPASHPVFDLEDEILREFSAFDARRVSHVEEHPVAAEVVHQELPEPEAVPVELHDVPERSVSASLARGRDVYESFRGDDLDDAISGAWAPEAVEPMPSAPVSAEAADFTAPDPAELVPVEQTLDTSNWANLDIEAALVAEGIVPPAVAEPEFQVDIQDYPASVVAF
jgi:hypothetical protein